MTPYIACPELAREHLLLHLLLASIDNSQAASDFECIRKIIASSHSECATPEVSELSEAVSNAKD